MIVVAIKRPRWLDERKSTSNIIRYAFLSFTLASIVANLLFGTANPEWAINKVETLLFIHPTTLKNSAGETSVKGNEMDGATTTKKRPAIAYLIPNNDEDIIKAIAGIKSLDRHLSDNQTTPILLFNEGNIRPGIKDLVQNITTRNLHWPEVDFQSFPKGFNPRRERQSFRKRSKWGYWQMCRFWISQIWNHNILDDYTSIMRMDTDSCFTNQSNPALPGLPDPSKHVYVANIAFWPAFSTKGLYEFTLDYLNRTGTIPRNEKLWDRIQAFKRKRGIMPSVYNNFEIDNISFFRRPDVMAFQTAITEYEPFGVYRRKWGDAPIRFLTLALFAKPDEILFNGYNIGYGHGGPCDSLHDTERAKITLE